MNNDLEKNERKHLAPDNESLHLDKVVIEDGNYYSKNTYDAMVKADMEED